MTSISPMGSATDTCNCAGAVSEECSSNGAGSVGNSVSGISNGAGSAGVTSSDVDLGADAANKWGSTGGVSFNMDSSPDLSDGAGSAGEVSSGSITGSFDGPGCVSRVSSKLEAVLYDVADSAHEVSYGSMVGLFDGADSAGAAAVWYDVADSTGLVSSGLAVSSFDCASSVGLVSSIIKSATGAWEIVSGMSGIVGIPLVTLGYMFLDLKQGYATSSSLEESSLLQPSFKSGMLS